MTCILREILSCDDMYPKRECTLRWHVPQERIHPKIDSTPWYNVPLAIFMSLTSLYLAGRWLWGVKIKIEEDTVLAVAMCEDVMARQIPLMNMQQIWLWETVHTSVTHSPAIGDATFTTYEEVIVPRRDLEVTAVNRILLRSDAHFLAHDRLEAFPEIFVPMARRIEWHVCRIRLAGMLLGNWREDQTEIGEADA